MGNISNQLLSSKNFFYSADSEHYQDAVLTYIFYNYPEPGKPDNKLSEIEGFSKYFTGLLLGNSSKDIKIEKIDVKTQVYDSDIRLIVHTADNKDHLIIIEDKTGSAIHRSVKKAKNSRDKNSKTLYYDTQLEKYYDKFIHDSDYQKYFKEGRIHLFYYKNEYINPFEERILEGAKKGCKKILCAPFNDDIEQIRKDIYKLKNDGQTHYDSTYESREAKIRNFESKNDDFASYYNKYGDSIVEWKKMGIDWIYETFNDYFKNEKPINLILRDYFESIEFWKNEIDKVLNNKYKIERSSGDDYLWGDRSKLWNPVFCQMVKSSLELIGDDYVAKVDTYAGRYWQMSIHSKDKKSCIITTTKDIREDSFSIAFNLRNKRYDGEDNVPAEWNATEGAREKDGKKIIEAIKNVIVEDTKPEASKRTQSGDQDNNKICSYNFTFKPGEKPDYNTLLNYWMKVLNVFVAIDGKIK